MGTARLPVQKECLSQNHCKHKDSKYRLQDWEIIYKDWLCKEDVSEYTTKEEQSTEDSTEQEARRQGIDVKLQLEFDIFKMKKIETKAMNVPENDYQASSAFVSCKSHIHPQLLSFAFQFEFSSRSAISTHQSPLWAVLVYISIVLDSMFWGADTRLLICRSLSMILLFWHCSLWMKAASERQVTKLNACCSEQPLACISEKTLACNRRMQLRYK